MKELKDLTFADNFMFTHILTTKKHLCKGLLERLLHIEIADIEYPEQEKAFKPAYETHGIRVDVFVKDSDRIFDIEMQTAHYGNIAMRSRYYQSMMDASVLQEGVDYEKLKESYVIFICLDDPFGDGKPVYTVEQKFKETDKIYNDKSHKVFYNVSAFSAATDDAEIHGFLKYVGTGNAETDFARELMEAVDFTKKMDAGFYHNYMMVKLHESDVRKEGFALGIQQGEHKARVETARGMLAYGMPKDKVAEISGLSLEEVTAITN